jgi:GNAT superfamily N-acetyltransferase
MTGVTVVRTYLEQRARPGSDRPVDHDPAVRLVRVIATDVALFRRLYREVGGPYHWQDRDTLSDDALHAHFASPDVQLWVLYYADAPAGFFELQRHADRSVEIVYFGLVRAFFGRGLGKRLLTEAAAAAWDLGADRVWLHTCTLDSPAALPNYLARGFEPFRTETYETSVVPSGAGA